MIIWTSEFFALIIWGWSTSSPVPSVRPSVRTSVHRSMLGHRGLRSGCLFKCGVRPKGEKKKINVFCLLFFFNPPPPTPVLASNVCVKVTLYIKLHFPPFSFPLSSPSFFFFFGSYGRFSGICSHAEPPPLFLLLPFFLVPFFFFYSPYSFGCSMTMATTTTERRGRVGKKKKKRKDKKERERQRMRMREKKISEPRSSPSDAAATTTTAAVAKTTTTTMSRYSGLKAQPPAAQSRRPTAKRSGSIEAALRGGSGSGGDGCGVYAAAAATSAAASFFFSFFFGSLVWLPTQTPCGIVAASDAHLTPNVDLDSIHNLLAAARELCSFLFNIKFLSSFFFYQSTSTHGHVSVSSFSSCSIFIYINRK